MAYGLDDGVTYLRDLSETTRLDLFSRQGAWEVALGELGVHLPPLALREQSRLWGHNGADTGAVFFCGRVYPFYVATIPDDTERRLRDPVRETLLFSWDKSFDTHVEQRSWSRSEHGDWRAALEAGVGRVDARVNLEHSSPVVAMMPGGHIGDVSGSEGRLHRVIVNPRLSDLHFQRVLDPFTAFQEIAMFMGGVLADTEDPPSPQSDKEKVASHGFDPKYGFRKPPQG